MLLGITFERVCKRCNLYANAMVKKVMNIPSAWWGNLIPYGADISFVTSWRSESPFCPPFPGSRVEAREHDQALTRYLEQWRFPLCFCRHDDSSSVSAQRNVNTLVLGFLIFFFLSDVTNTCAPPYKLHLVLSLQPRISGCPTLPFKAAKQITNQADWYL